MPNPGLHTGAFNVLRNGAALSNMLLAVIRAISPWMPQPPSNPSRNTGWW